VEKAAARAQVEKVAARALAARQATAPAGLAA
jgi:hypothetical protein